MRGDRSFRLAHAVRRAGPGLLGLAAPAAAALYLTHPGIEGPVPRATITATVTPTAVAPTLYCEFDNLASRIPKVGF